MVKDMKSSGYFVIGIIFLIILFIVVSFKFNVYKITFVVDNEIYKKLYNLGYDESERESIKNEQKD